MRAAQPTHKITQNIFTYISKFILCFFTTKKIINLLSQNTVIPFEIELVRDDKILCFIIICMYTDIVNDLQCCLNRIGLTTNGHDIKWVVENKFILV